MRGVGAARPDPGGRRAGRPRTRGRAHARARRRDRARHPPRRGRVRRGRRRADRRRRAALAALRPHVLRRAGHGAGAPDARRRRRGPRPARARCWRSSSGAALEHRDTICVGRTHGVHAEPTTFGHKLALWAFELDRDRDRLRRAREAVSVGKLSGVVGTYSQVDPRVEEYVCGELGLRPAEAASQVVAARRARRVRLARWRSPRRRSRRSRLEVRHLARTEVREVEEPFGAGQKGSSRDAAQAQPDHVRARLRPGPRGPGEPAGGAGGRRAVARAGHLALVASSA